MQFQLFYENLLYIFFFLFIFGILNRIFTIVTTFSILFFIIHCNIRAENYDENVLNGIQIEEQAGSKVHRHGFLIQTSISLKLYFASIQLFGIYTFRNYTKKNLPALFI